MTVPLVKLRARFIAENSTANEALGYFNNVITTIWVKQEGEKILVKRADERVKGESKREYESFDAFTDEWTINFKFILK